MSKKDERKGRIVTLKIGEDMMSRVPQVFGTVYRIKETPVTDNEDLDEDETYRLHTLVTVDVEGVTVVDGGKAVNVNGDFDISLDPEVEIDTWANKDEAIARWEELTDAQLNRAKKAQEKIDQTVICLQTSKDERQY